MFEGAVLLWGLVYPAAPQEELGSPVYTRTHCAVAGAARTGESRKQAGVGSAAALCVVCEHKHTKRRRLRRFDSKGADA